MILNYLQGICMEYLDDFSIILEDKLQREVPLYMSIEYLNTITK